MNYEFYCPDCSSYFSSETLKLHNDISASHIVRKTAVSNPSAILGNKETAASPQLTSAKQFNTELEREERLAPQNVRDFIRFLDLDNYNPPIFADVPSEFIPAQDFPHISLPKAEQQRMVEEEVKIIKQLNAENKLTMTATLHYIEFLSKWMDTLSSKKCQLLKKHRLASEKLSKCGNDKICLALKDIIRTENQLSSVDGEIDLYNQARKYIEDSPALFQLTERGGDLYYRNASSEYVLCPRRL